MPRRFVALNFALAAAATLLIVYIVRQFVAPMPLPVGGRRAAGPGSPQAAHPPPQPAQPGMVPPGGQPPVVGVPSQPGVTPPVIPGRRPLPPNLLRRLPPGMGDAPQQ